MRDKIDRTYPSNEKDPSMYAKNTIQGLILGIPYIGSSLERFIFGVTQEKRWIRLEKTLEEIANTLKTEDTMESIYKEEFVSLLEFIAPSIARTTSDFKRQCFKTLLLNSTVLPEGSTEWEETRLITELIEKIEMPGLELIATLYNLKKEKVDIAIVFDEPSYLAVWPNDKSDSLEKFPLSYGYVVIEEWIERLSQLKLINKTRPLRRPEGSKDSKIIPGYGNLLFTRLGDLFVRWCMSDFDITSV